MRKILTIANREYRAMVGTKAFLLSVIMMPVLMFGGMAAIQFLQNVGEVKERRIIVFEGNNHLFDALLVEAEKHNAALKASENASASNDANKDERVPAMSRGEYFHLEKSSTPVLNDDLRIQLSRAIREGDLYGFLEIPDDLMSKAPGSDIRVKFHSQDSSIADARNWLMQSLNTVIRHQRLRENFSDEQIQKINNAGGFVNVMGMGLVDQASDGKVQSAMEKNEIADIFLPMGLMMLMFMVIFMAAQPTLECVLEEKSLRIAEVLLGSVSSFQLMLGKLLGTVGGSLTIFLIYLAGSYFVAFQRGWTDHVPLHLIPWFLVFQVLGVMFYASIFMAVGASVSQLKEAQAMLLPVWMVMMLPIFVWLFIIRDPLGPLATWFSLFPPATSTTMMLRLATNQSIPIWQLVAGLLGLILSTLLVITLAGRIFRVGILWQGKVPKLNEVLHWAIKG